MRFPAKSLIFAAFLSVVSAQPTRADVFVWNDAETELTLSFPDTWRQVHNQSPDEIVNIAAPDDGGYAGCRMRVREDRRFLVYPRQYAGQVQRENYSRDFWQTYINEFDNAKLNGVWDDGALGDGFASFADISFATRTGPNVQKRGLAFATVYNDKAYILECSAETSVYDSWYKNFLSVVKSVDLRNEYHKEPYGWYRNFLEDPVLRIHGEKGGDLYTY